RGFSLLSLEQCLLYCSEMCPYRAIGVFLLAAAAAVGADTSSYNERRAYTVVVDSRSGRLVRVPVKSAAPEAKTETPARGESRPTQSIAPLAPIDKEPLE